MRIAVASLLSIALLAGCLSGNPDDPQSPTPRLTQAGIVVPDGAILQAIEGGFAAVWDGVDLPLSTSVTLPEGATMVRAVTTEGGGSVSMSNAETGRRRCNNPTVESFSDAFAYPKSCSGVTAIDLPGTVWNVFVGAPAVGGGAVGVAGSAPTEPAKGNVRVEFLDAPLDGLLARLDLSSISPPTLGVQGTTVQFVPSFDGVALRVEVTLPEGPGPWPVVIESSPYHDDGLRSEPASFAYFVEDWARRGYAIVTADVRGFGDSGGCVEVWGPNEQADQRFLVEWAAGQPWSDGNIGFYGQSYVATTPVEAAVQAPAALKAIIAVAPVINSYEDWHYGGVPNGESTGSPAAYQVLTEGVTGDPSVLLDERFRTDPQRIANNAANGLCDPTLAARANDPRAIYDQFYEERDFKRRAADVKAAVLYTQGFEDANVKGAMIPGWFNGLQSPKLGLFGHWLHQHPPRLDCEALMVAWMEQYLKGKDIGLEDLPAAAITVDRGTERYADEWPPSRPTATSLFPDVEGTALGTKPTEGAFVVLFDHTGQAGPGVPPLAALRAEYTGTLAQETSLAGSATLHVHGALQGAGNGYLFAELWVDGSLLTYGQLNLAHNADHTQYAPVAPFQANDWDLPFRPTESVLPAGAQVTLVLRGVAVEEATDPGGVGATGFTFVGGADGTRLDLPGVALSEYHELPLSAKP